MAAHLLAKLARMGNLHRGWDGYDAEAPNEIAIRHARKVLRFLGEREGTAQVRIEPSAEGGVTIILSPDGSRYADIECFNDGEILALTSERGSDPTIWRVEAEPESLRVTTEKLAAFLNG